MESIPEQRDELAGPQRGERAVERQPDVRVLADAFDGLGWNSREGQGSSGFGRRAGRVEGALDRRLERPSRIRCEYAGRRRGESLPCATQQQRAFECGTLGDRASQARLACAAELEIDTELAGAGQAGQSASDRVRLRVGQLLWNPDHTGEQEECEARGEEGIAD